MDDIIKLSTAVIFIVTIAAVLNSVTDQQSPDTLWVIGTTLELALGTAIACRQQYEHGHSKMSDVGKLKRFGTLCNTMQSNSREANIPTNIRRLYSGQQPLNNRFLNIASSPTSA